MQNRPMTNKPRVGYAPARKGYPEREFIPRDKRRDDTGKVRVYLPELRMTVLVDPGADIAAITKKHLEAREWNRKTIH